MKRVTATFKGKNGSMGFISGMRYDLSLRRYSNGLLSVNNRNGFGWCEYGSFVAFLNNWDDVKSI